MHNVLMVIRREYLDRVRKKSFWVGILLFPLIMAALMAAPALMMAVAAPEEKHIAVIDATGRLLPWIEKGVAEEKLGNGRPEYRLESIALPPGGDPVATGKQQEARVAADELFGVLSIGPDPDAPGAIRFSTRKVGNIEAVEELRRSVRDAVTTLRFERGSVGIPPDRLRELTRPVEVQTFQVSEEGRTTRKGFFETWLGTMMFVMVLYMTLLLYGIAVMRGVLEEKTTRVVEVLLGSLTPDELMIGKILGVGLVGLTQVGFYVVLAILARLLSPGDPSGAVANLVNDSFTPEKMIYFVIFFVLGYFMYTAVFAMVGAVCNTEQEAQNLQSPVVFCLVIPLVAALYFVNNPDSTPAVVASLIPIFTPMVMYMRISVLTPPFWQIALSIVLLLATTWLFFRGAAKVFRIGILMYGKRPTVPEILRWARGPAQPVSAGAVQPGYERGARP